MGTLNLMISLQTLTSRRYAWDSATVIGLFCGFVGNLAVWAIYNYWKGDKALIPFSMMKPTVVWTSCLFLCVLMGSMMGKSLLHVIYGTHILIYPPQSCKLLLANLLPSCRWRHSNNERCLPTTEHSWPALRRRNSWSSG